MDGYNKFIVGKNCTCKDLEAFKRWQHSTLQRLGQAHLKIILLSLDQSNVNRASVLTDDFKRKRQFNWPDCRPAWRWVLCRAGARCRRVAPSRWWRGCCRRSGRRRSTPTPTAGSLGSRDLEKVIKLLKTPFHSSELKKATTGAPS